MSGKLLQIKMSFLQEEKQHTHTLSRMSEWENKIRNIFQIGNKLTTNASLLCVVLCCVVCVFYFTFNYIKLDLFSLVYNRSLNALYLNFLLLLVWWYFTLNLFPILFRCLLCDKHIDTTIKRVCYNSNLIEWRENQAHQLNRSKTKSNVHNSDPLPQDVWGLVKSLRDLESKLEFLISFITKDVMVNLGTNGSGRHYCKCHSSFDCLTLGNKVFSIASFVLHLIFIISRKLNVCKKTAHIPRDFEVL